MRLGLKKFQPPLELKLTSEVAEGINRTFYTSVLSGNFLGSRSFQMTKKKRHEEESEGACTDDLVNMRSHKPRPNWQDAEVEQLVRAGIRTTKDPRKGADNKKTTLEANIKSAWLTCIAEARIILPDDASNRTGYACWIKFQDIKKCVLEMLPLVKKVSSIRGTVNNYLYY